MMRPVPTYVCMAAAVLVRLSVIILGFCLLLDALVLRYERLQFKSYGFAHFTADAERLYVNITARRLAVLSLPNSQLHLGVW